MANLARVRTVWSGTPVIGGGVSTFYFDEAHTGFVADLHNFWAALGIRVKTGVTWTTAPTGDLIDVATGELSGTWTDGVISIVNASSANNYAAGVGARISWPTSGIRNGRRVKGSTFVVPLTTDCYEADGTIGAAYLGTIQTAATNLLAASAGNQRVYSRPAPSLSGQANTVIDAVAPDKVSWLRSRRT